jgi:uncharacterized membrane protein
MVALFGTAVACAALAVWALFRLDDDFAAFLLVAAALYLIGTIWVTMRLNVPRNNALAAVEPSAPEAERVWTRYVAEGTGWNHVRTAAALAAAAALTVALAGG